LPDDRPDTARPEAPTPAIARLLEAEQKADELVKRAQKEAEEIVVAAKRRAQKIRQAAGSAEMGASEASRAREEIEKQKRLILEEGKGHIETMRTAAAARLPEAVEKLTALLVAEP
jgi:vacuolar-type H+-ATPase subunit H